ncbi:MAG: DUF87 domain-containing protein [Candidatus Odinarchaeota archaeon]|nr:DUF87 domain-containing protein [Candidatus Odinarchaeota archaeon]
MGHVEYPLRLGYLVGTSRVAAAIDVNNLTRHIIIVGGTGKSYFRGLLIELLYDLGVPQINFDILNEYETAVQKLGGLNLRLGENYRPRLDYLSPDEFEHMIEQYVPTPFQKTIAK